VAKKLAAFSGLFPRRSYSFVVLWSRCLPALRTSSNCAPFSSAVERDYRTNRARLAGGELDQAFDLVGRRIGVEIEAQPNVAEADRRLPANPQRAAKIEVALGADPAAAQFDVERPGDRAGVTPAQATSASSNMSPEPALSLSPPVAGRRPASTSARPVSTLRVKSSSPSRPSPISAQAGRPWSRAARESPSIG
jgi:hypothetical protein